MLAHEADGVGIVYHHKRAILVRKVAYCGKVGYITVHAEYAVSRYQLYTAILGSLKLSLKILHVIVLVTEALCLAKADAVYNACMVQLV